MARIGKKIREAKGSSNGNSRRAAVAKKSPLAVKSSARSCAKATLATHRGRLQPSREDESNYLRLFHQMADAVFVIDAETLRFLDCNLAACQAYGYSRQQMLGMTPLDLHPCEEQDVARRRLRTKKWAAREYHHVTKSGRRLTVEINTTDILFHGRPAHLSIVHDISERSLAQQKLALHVESTPLAVIEWNTKSEVTEWNPAAQRIFGYTREEALGSKASFIAPEASRGELAQVWRDLLTRTGGTRSTNQNRTRDGRLIYCEWYNTPLVDSSAAVIGVASLCEDVTERIRAQQSLAVQKAYLEQLFESAPEGIAIVGEEQRITRVNREFSRIFGYSFEEVVGQTLEMLVPPDRVSESRFIQRMAARGVNLNVETTRRRKDGSLVDVSILGTPIHGTGEHRAIYLIYRDITESKRAERALTESESKFRAVAETAASAICIHDGTQFLYVNKACEQISGYTREELLAMHPLAIMDTASREQVRKGELPLDAPIRGEVSIVTKPGQARWIDAIANRIQFEGRSAVLVTGVDITERKRSERLQSALYRIAEQTSYAQDLQQFYAAIHAIIAELMYAENFYVAIYDEDRDLLTFPYFKDAVDPAPAPKPLGRGLTEFVLRTGEPQLVSPERFEHLVGVGEVELIGAPSVDWLGVPMKKGDQAFGALVVQSYTEVARYGEQEKELLTFVSQHIASVVERKRQLEALRSSEAQLRQSQKMEAVGRLAGGVAHDFNNLLTVIKGYSELALEEMSESDPLYAGVQEIQRAADRAASLTRQLLAFSRRQVLAPKVLDLNQLMVDAQKLLRRLLGEDVELITSLDPQLGSVRADPHQIEQVLMNLAVNAKDAMPHGGKLIIETGNVDFNRDYTHHNVAVRPGAYVMLAITDTGTGMDAETSARVFEPFFTTKEQGKGTGLGLSTVYGIVKQSGGYVWVDSEIGSGSSFKIYLPRVGEIAERAPLRPARPEVHRGLETILLVEDEAGVRALIRQVLQRHGYTVLDCAHGAEAVRAAERHQGRIHLLLTDVVLSQMNGRQLAERLLEIRGDVRVLYMSGYTDEAIAHHGVLTPGSDFLQKPFTNEALARKVREILDKS